MNTSATEAGRRVGMRNGSMKSCPYRDSLSALQWTRGYLEGHKAYSLVYQHESRIYANDRARFEMLWG